MYRLHPLPPPLLNGSMVRRRMSLYRRSQPAIVDHRWEVIKDTISPDQRPKQEIVALEEPQPNLLFLTGLTPAPEAAST